MRCFGVSNNYSLKQTTMNYTKDHELNDKLTAIIQQKQPNALQQVANIRRDADNLVDFIAPVGALADKRVVNFTANGEVKANIHDGPEILQYGLHQHAIFQFGEKLNVPSRYLRDLATSGEEWQRQLAAHTLNETSSRGSRQRLLFRSIGDQIRGVLSDAYRRMDTGVILAQFLNACDGANAIIFDAAHTDTKSFVEVLLPQPFDLETEGNGKLGLLFGMRISNSDFGDGALRLSSFLVNGACWNGLVFKSSINQVHLGRRLPDNIQFAEDTYRADTEAQAKAVRDTVKTLMGKDRIVELAQGIKGATTQEVKLDSEITRLKRLGGGLSKGEVLEVEERLKYNRVDDGLAGNLTRWKMANAVTAVARDTEDQRRRREIEEIGGLLLNL